MRTDLPLRIFRHSLNSPHTFHVKHPSPGDVCSTLQREIETTGWSVQNRTLHVKRM